MASATVDSAAAESTTDGGLLRLDSIPIVDLRLLSQSELYSLSRCSSSAADRNRRNDVVIPIIDRSVFNESAGSRKQTYSRLRLAPTDSSSAATPRCRTPRLRSTAAAYGAINSKTDPENVENHQIINLLKQFFVADMDPAHLFPVKIEYLNSLPVQQVSSPPSPPPDNPPLIGAKRKRGRPRKAVEVSVIDGSYADTLQLPMPSLSEFVPLDNAEDKDREVLNSNGVAVDLAALGASEHPYREEIRQRTDGMRTEEELLGFLTGLNGRWGSRRKKKRIVDANEFGSKLPVGWQLSLSVKKKNGNVWLYCRRYISPSGLHFVTCKGVSSYLLSLHGMQDTNPCSFGQYNDIVNDADKLTTVPLTVQGDHEIETFSHAPSPPLDLVTVNPEIQVTENVGNAPEVRIGESLCCHKCNITFKDKDEFLNHQSSLHRKNRNKNIVRITDGVIIKDGKYECQFCHKTFSERHRYNGHVGTHVRFQPKIVGEFSQSVYPTSVNVYPTLYNAMEGSKKSHNAMDVCYTITNNGPTICSNPDKIDGHFGELEDASRSIRGMDKATDTVTETNHSAVPEVLFTSNVSQSLHEGACLNDSAAEISKDGSMMQEGMMMESTLSPNGAAVSDMNSSVIENSVSTDNPMQIMASKSCLLYSNDHMEECPVVNDNQHTSDDSNQKTTELNFDTQNLGLNESIFSLFGTQGQGQQEKDLAVSNSGLEFLPRKDIATTESITSGPEASKLEKGPNISMPIADNGKTCKEDNVPCSAVTCKVGDTLSFSKCENDSSKANNDGANMHEELQYGMDSVIQTWNTQENATKKDGSEVFTHLLDVPGVHGMPKSQLAANDKNTYHYENNDGGVCGRETKMPEFDCLQNFGSGQSSDLFSSSSAIVSSNSFTGTNQDTRLGVCSPFTSTTDKQLSAEDNMITLFNDTVEEHRQDPSGCILHNQFCVSDVSNEAFTSNKVYTAANPSELSGIAIAGKHELSLSFGSLQTDMCAESNRVEQESYRANSFNIEPVGPKTYGDPTHSSILSSNIAADMERARPFGYSNVSFNDTTNESGSSFNVVHPERDWDGTRGNEVRTSSQNFMVGFGNSSLPTSECAAADGSWRNGPDNLFGGCYDANSAPHIPSSSFFPTFGLAPTTGQESSFGVDHNYSIQSDMMRPVRAQPVEYSFMSEQRVNSLPGEAKNFPYGSNMEQEMDPSFWLGKDALTPNASRISQATSICVWCRNVFLNEHAEAGVQTGAIGTICPSCSSRIPGHFNVL
ncbi:methyl-CpG-binding domain-containing protein [Salvia divinorum]|uniref:Methyl-CpG-binding domain-containing protein n=1 Tax=Salvia divinorum TaxID=28513 RepID=A0ABD1GSB6_SALDI